jgi:hypothetical protein
MEWKPIESAPKDGSAVLLTTTETESDYAICRLGYWTTYNKIGDWYSVSDDCKVGITPTHWMALPEPPDDAPRADE